MSETLDLRLSEGVRRTFARVLEGVLTLGVGADVAGFLGNDPWGDLTAYRHEVLQPMTSGQPAVGDEAAPAAVPVHALPRVNAVLHDLYEGFSGGRPWAGVDDADRVIFEGLAEQVRAEPT